MNFTMLKLGTPSTNALNQGETKPTKGRKYLQHITQQRIIIQLNRLNNKNSTQ